MMRSLPALTLLAALSVSAQTPVASPSPSATPSAVAPTQAVITLQGFCGADAAPHDATASHANECSTTITREQFEKLLDALNPSHKAVSREAERNLAQAYVELMLFSTAAHKDGVEKDPNYEAVLSLIRMRALADLYRRELEQRYRDPSSQEIEDFYQKNYSSYERLRLRTLSIPRNNLAVDDQEAYNKQAVQVARDVRERVVKGEDMAALEKEAYKTLGLTVHPASTDATVLRPADLAPEAAADVLELGNGGVSKVEVEPSAYVIYKLESKQTVALDQVKNEIVSKIVQKKINARLQEIESTVHTTLNDQYFGEQKGPTLESLH